MKKYFTLLTCLLATFLSYSQTPTLSKDINTKYLSGNPSNYFVHGNYMYFTAQNNTSQGSELWRTDGTDTGTYMVKEIFAGVGSSSPSNYCSVGNILYFTANNGTNGIELWKTDGTSTGTAMVKDIRSGAVSSSPSLLTNLNGLLLFVADDGSYGKELWKSDGSDTGTVLVMDIRSGTSHAGISEIVAMGNNIYFTADDGIKGLELWFSDGTTSGTQLLKDIRNGSSSSAITGLIVFKNELYFAANDGINGVELWKSDGTNSGTKIYQDHFVGTGSTSPSLFVVVKGNLYFRGNDKTYGSELMKVNGTDTIQVIDVDPYGSSSPMDLVNVNGTLYFTASVDNGIELYISDGTLSGTKLTRDLYPIQTDALIKYMTAVDSTLYFTAHESPNYQDIELYSSTPSSPYPRRVKDIVVGAASNPTNLTSFKGKLFFSVNDQVNGNEMWTATAKTADLFKDIYQGTLGSGIQSIAALKGSVIFNAVTDLGDELWTSAGDTASTFLLKDIVSGTGNSQPRKLYSTGSEVFFSCNTGAASVFNKTNGTKTGTGSISITGGTSGLAEFTYLNEELYFVRQSSSILDLLYKYTSKNGANKIKNINPNNLGDDPANLTVFNNELYFSADDGNTSGNELFKSNGTSSGTVIVKDIYPDRFDANPRNLKVVDSLLFFTANDGTRGSELWVTKGSSANTKLVKDIHSGSTSSGISNMTNFKHKAFFTANDGQSGIELWSSDGTAAGTNLFMDLVSGSVGSNPKNLFAVDSFLYFLLDDTIHGTELWISDGTPSGTHLLKDINAGKASSNIKNFTKVRNYLYFSANDGIHGQELWRTDGTTVGTTLLPEVISGSASSNPELLTLVGDTLYYTADHPFYGNELWWMFTNCMVSGLQFNNTCVGDNIAFKDNTKPLGTTINSYLWVLGDGDSATTANVNHSYSTPGTYLVSLRVGNTDGCFVNSQKEVMIRPLPQVSFTQDKDNQCFKGNSVKFNNNSTSSAGEPLVWNFGDGQNSTVENPTYNFKAAGTFDVKLIIGSSAVCSDTAVKSIVIHPTPAAPIISGKTVSFNNAIDSFTTPLKSGSTYKWTVTNGTILKGNNSEKIVVQWNASSTSATVDVFETNSFGCAGDAKKQTVSLSMVGLNFPLSALGFEVYPNPTKDRITLVKKASDNSNYFIQVTDVLGSVLIEQEWNTQQSGTSLNLDLSNHKAGVYQIVIHSERKVYSSKIVLLE